MQNTCRYGKTIDAKLRELHPRTPPHKAILKLLAKYKTKRALAAYLGYSESAVGRFVALARSKNNG